MPRREIKSVPFTIKELIHWHESKVCFCETCVTVRKYYNLEVHLYCKDCGWRSEPYQSMPMGLGGIFNCPECQKANRNPTLEMCFGSVEIEEY